MSNALATTSKDDSSATAPVVILDALPYIDPVHEEYEQYALALIEEEMKAHPATAVKKVKAVNCRTEVMSKEYQEQSASGGSLERPALHNNNSSAVSAPQGAAAKDPDAWKQAVQEARIAYESERIRSVLLELEKGGVGSSLQNWKAYNELLAKSQELFQQALETQQRSVEDLNHGRQKNQQESGRQLEVLTRKYQELLHKLFQLKRAVAEMEQ